MQGPIIQQVFNFTIIHGITAENCFMWLHCPMWSNISIVLSFKCYGAIKHIQFKVGVINYLYSGILYENTITTGCHQ